MAFVFGVLCTVRSMPNCSYKSDSKTWVYKNHSPKIINSKNIAIWCNLYGWMLFIQASLQKSTSQTFALCSKPNSCFAKSEPPASFCHPSKINPQKHAFCKVECCLFKQAFKNPRSKLVHFVVNQTLTEQNQNHQLPFVTLQKPTPSHFKNQEPSTKSEP